MDSKYFSTNIIVPIFHHISPHSADLEDLVAGPGQGEDIGEAQHRDDDEQSLDTGTNQMRGPGSRDQVSTNHSSP